MCVLWAPDAHIFKTKIIVCYLICIMFHIFKLLLYVNRLLKGRSFPGKVLITRRLDPPDGAILGSPGVSRSSSEIDSPPNKHMDDSSEVLLMSNIYVYLILMYEYLFLIMFHF